MSGRPGGNIQHCNMVCHGLRSTQHEEGTDPRQVGHICDLRDGGALLEVRTNMSGSQIRNRFVISVTTVPRGPGRYVFGATSSRGDIPDCAEPRRWRGRPGGSRKLFNIACDCRIRGSTRRSQIRDGWFSSVTSASAPLSCKFGELDWVTDSAPIRDICDPRTLLVQPDSFSEQRLAVTTTTHIEPGG